MDDPRRLIVANVIMILLAIGYRFWFARFEAEMESKPKRTLPPQRFVVLEADSSEMLSYKMNLHMERVPSARVIEIQTVAVPGGWTFGPYVKYVATMSNEPSIQNRMEPS